MPRHPAAGLAGEWPGLPSTLDLAAVSPALQEGVALVQADGCVLHADETFTGLVAHRSALIESLDRDGVLLAAERHPWAVAITTGTSVKGVVLGLPDQAMGEGTRWLSVTAVPTRVRDFLIAPTPDNDVTERVALVTAVDVTATVRAIVRLAEAEQRFRQLCEHAPLGIAVLSLRGVVLECNEVFSRLLGYDNGGLLGKSSQSLTHPDDLAMESAQVAAMVAGGTPTYVALKRYLRRTGETTWVQVTVSLAHDAQGRPAHLLTMAEDVSAERETGAALAHLTSHDELTGLVNRAAFVSLTSAALLRAADSGRPIGLLVCDLDHFKLVNDSRGHEAGDAVLIETAERLATCIRDGDVAARLGGDEFAVLCESLPSEQHAEHVAQRLIDEVTLPMHRAPGVSLTASVGIALSEPGMSAADLLRNADAALYRAKENGRDRHALFAPELIERAARRLGIEHELREAMRAEQLFLDYQPVLRLGDSVVAAYEALVRWNHPTRGILAPDAFLPVAEASDLILELDRYVLLRACQDAADWADNGSGTVPSVSVNISARHVGRGLLPGLVARALGRSGLDPARLTLELTETALLGVSPTAITELDTLVDLGLRLAIDDFGTGYSSLTHLVHVPAAYVKIDRSFVGRMGDSDASAAIVEAVVSLCRALKIDVVAEGIEDEGQRSALSALGCLYGQGFLLGRPGQIDLTAVQGAGP